jgi:two-component system phosphate regulon sensor histidine kinase PhoR
LFRGIQWKIAVPFILLTLVTMTILGIYLVNFARNLQLENLRSSLEKEASITAEATLPAFLGEDGNQDVLAKKLGQEIDTRITIIALDGTVLGDSNEDPATMENHATRPEVAEALAGSLGESQRYSTTLNENMLYVAAPIKNGSQVLGVARVALPLTTVQKSVNQVTLATSLATLAATVMVLIAATIVARITTRPVREVTEAAKRIARGELSQKIPVHDSDETGRLAQSFNDMSSKLSSLMEEISNEKGKLSTVLNNITDAIIMTDIEGSITLTNPAAESLFNFRLSENINRPFIELVHDHEAEDILKKCLKIKQTQTAQFESGFYKRFFRVIGVPVIEENYTGALLVFQDLTEIRNLQTMRRELVGNISHELRTPLAGIRAMVETLKEGAINQEDLAMDYLGRIEVEIDRLTQMVSELTELSQIETGRASLNKSITDINLLVEEVVKQMAPLAQREQVTIFTDLNKNLPTINIDHDRVQQTLVNLVHNAIKFNRSGGNITISTKSDGKSIITSISDTGIGISKEDLPHVFERFYKVDRARTRSGSGLGLAIAKHTIQAHGGAIWAESIEGKGSTFYFSFPLNRP